jgi:hypothetical protein
MLIRVYQPPPGLVRPGRASLDDAVEYPVRSSDGKRWYPVRVAGGQVTCLCPGFTNHGHCWHASSVRVFHMSVLPPPELPRKPVPVPRRRERGQRCAA